MSTLLLLHDIPKDSMQLPGDYAIGASIYSSLVTGDQYYVERMQLPYGLYPGSSEY